MADNNTSSLTAQSLIAFGLPWVIAQAVVPKLLTILKRYPRTTRYLTYLLALLSTFGAFTFGVKPLFERFVWKWLPVIKIDSSDRVYPHLRKLIKPKAALIVPNKLLASSKTHKDYDDTTRYPRIEDEEEENVQQWAEKREVMFKNPSSRVFVHNGTIFVMESPLGWDDTHGQLLEIRALALSLKHLKSLFKDAWAAHQVARAALNTTDIFEPNDEPGWSSDPSDWVMKENKLVRPLSLLNQIPGGSVLLLEDIDSAGIKREGRTTTYNRRTNVTLSGLLNALDGASAPEGHLIIMSTNVSEALDPALVPAGRVDCTVEFKNANKIAAVEMFVRMMCDDENDEKNQGLQAKAEEFVNHIPDEIFSLAEIQGYLIYHARDTEGAITKEAAGKDREADEQRKEEKAKDLELVKRKNILEDGAMKDKEVGATALAKSGLETRQATLKAKRLRAEHEIAHLQAKKARRSTMDQQTPATPADSDDEQQNPDALSSQSGGGVEHSISDKHARVNQQDE